MIQRWLYPHFSLADDAGGFGLPSIATNDEAYLDQDYWRGRVWAPMNYLVYVGLSHPAYAASKIVDAARIALAEASESLFLFEWLDKHHVHENLNAETGRGGDTVDSNPFYHWGSLSAVPNLKEKDLL